MDPDWLEERALRYVSQWEASEAGVRALLERKVHQRCERTGESPDVVLEEIPAIVARLVERNYVNDLRFAEGSLERQRRRGASTAQVRLKFEANGISESTVETLLAREELEAESDAAWGIARRRQLGPYRKDPVKREQSRDRDLGVLTRKGFDHDTAQLIIDAKLPPGLD